MTDPVPFEQLLTLIDDRSEALRGAARAAPDLAARVPGCPEWTLDDLVYHLAVVQRFWAAAVRLADVSGPPGADQRGETEPPGDIFDWSAEATGLLLDALRAAGPDSPCWAWWGESGAPLTAGAVARHQVQEAAVHARDAQETAGEAEPLPGVVAVDGLAEFLTVPLASRGGWPHRPARIAFAATDGPTTVIDLSSSGVALDPAASGEPLTTVHAPASDLVLALYGRVPFADLRVEGDAAVLAELRDWSKAE
jgi:uncharacterized protein (TIGR03083 family)